MSTPGQENLLLQTERNAHLRKEVAPDLPLAWSVDSEPFSPNASEARLIQDSSVLLASAPTSNELEHFNLVKAERARGWRCPDGTYFPPNNGEFKWDCRLSRAARKWSQRMATEDFIAHQKGGSTSCIRTHAEGFPKDR